ncbi:hypothetical protein D3C80_1800740 [compost metagenome]
MKHGETIKDLFQDRFLNYQKDLPLLVHIAKRHSYPFLIGQNQFHFYLLYDNTSDSILVLTNSKPKVLARNDVQYP